MSRLSEGLGIPELEEFNRDYKPQSNPESIKEFMKSSIFKDYINELKVRIEDIRDFLEVSDSKKYHAAQGAVAFARLMLGIFENLLENKLSDTEEELNNQKKEVE